MPAQSPPPFPPGRASRLPCSAVPVCTRWPPTGSPTGCGERWGRPAAQAIATASEKATGSTIRPGAVIGHRLFEEHGSDVVLGATSVTGDEVIFDQGASCVGGHPQAGAGAGGTIGLSQFVQDPGREDALMVTGGVMVGAIELADNPESFDDVVPIARMADDYAALVVPADSKFQTLEDFLTAWKQDPGANSIGGGSLGSIDHLLSGLLAKEVGIDPLQVNYVAYSGGGEALNSLLSHTTAAGMSGYNEVKDQVEAGNLRALAISSPERLEGVEVPTFREQGVDVSMSNWRGVVAAPGITEEAKNEFIDIVTEWHATPEWQDALARNNWDDTFSTGEEFEDFIDAEVATAQQIVKDLGL